MEEKIRQEKDPREGMSVRFIPCGDALEKMTEDIFEEKEKPEIKG